MIITGRGSRPCALKERGEVAKKGLATRTLQPRPPALKPPAAEDPAPGRLSSSPTLLILGPGQSSVKATLKNQHPILRISSGLRSFRSPRSGQSRRDAFRHHACQACYGAQELRKFGGLNNAKVGVACPYPRRQRSCTLTHGENQMPSCSG